MFLFFFFKVSYWLCIIEKMSNIFYVYFFLVVSEKITKKRVKFRRIPTLNMPKKHHEVKKDPRPPPKARCIPSVINVSCYSSLDNSKARLPELKCLQNWNIVITPNKFILQKPSHQNLTLPELEIVIAEDLTFIVIVFGWKIPLLHFVYNLSQHSFKNITVFNLIADLQTLKVCHGVPLSYIATNIVIHAIPFKVNYETISISETASYKVKIITGIKTAMF